MHNLVEEGLKQAKREKYLDNKVADKNEVIFSPDIEQTILASKKESTDLNTEVVQHIMKIEDDVYSIKNSEETVVDKFNNFILKVYDKLVELFLILMPSKSKKTAFRKNKLDSNTKKALEQFKQLASFYIMYCNTDEELMAFEFAFDKTYHDIITHSKCYGYDEGYFKIKLDDFISVFEPR
jgi:uncharacterized phage infection (PIP) family protein YhgE